MTLQPGTAVGGDFLDWPTEIAKTADQKVLAIARIREFHPAEAASGYAGTNYPVTVDWLFCSGPRAGEAELADKCLGGGITGALRGIKNPKKDSGLPLSPPVNRPGMELGFTMRTKRNGAVIYAVADAPTAEEYAVIQRVYADGQGWANAAAAEARNVAAAHAASAPAPVANQPNTAPVMSTATGVPVVHQQPVPAQPAGPTAEQLAQFAAWQAQQAAVQNGNGGNAAPAMTPAGPPAETPWRAVG